MQELDAGILDEAFIMLGADHGMDGYDHSSGPWPGKRVPAFEISYVISHPSLRQEESIPVSQQEIAPTILAAMGVDLSLITPAYIDDSDTRIQFWEKKDSVAPKIKTTFYKTRSMDNFDILSNDREIKGLSDLKMEILEWSSLRTATVKIGDNVINADFNSSEIVE